MHSALLQSSVSRFCAVSSGVRKMSNYQTEALRCCSVKVDNYDEVKKQRGALIVLEGLDRSGKSSQASKLATCLEGLGVSAELWRFPDRNTSVGLMISSYLSNKSQLDDHTIHLLFSANRWEKRSLMEDKLKGGTTLIVDRYSYSGVAFSSAKGLSLDWCKAPEVGLLAPDLVFYLDISPEKAAERGGYGDERYEQLDFQRKVAEQYKLLQDASWKMIDARLSVDEVHNQIKELALNCIKQCGEGEPISQLWVQKIKIYHTKQGDNSKRTKLNEAGANIASSNPETSSSGGRTSNSSFVGPLKHTSSKRVEKRLVSKTKTSNNLIALSIFSNLKTRELDIRLQELEVKKEWLRLHVLSEDRKTKEMEFKEKNNKIKFTLLFRLIEMKDSLTPEMKKLKDKLLEEFCT